MLTILQARNDRSINLDTPAISYAFSGAAADLFEMTLAPAGLGARSLGYPGLTAWANSFRAFGAWLRLNLTVSPIRRLKTTRKLDDAISIALIFFAPFLTDFS